MAKRLEVKTGDRYGRLTILKEVSPYVSPNGSKARRVLVQCDCGNSEPFEVLLNNLRSGHTISCGCLAKEKVKKYNTYDLSGEYGIGYTSKGEEFLFDLEDYPKIKDFCWLIDNRGYVVARDLGTKKMIYIHRLIMNASEGMEIDHRFHDKNDNRKENLREVTRSQNQMNSRIRKDNASGVIGVSWHRQTSKWRAQIKINGKMIYLGTYINIEDAISARRDAEEKYFGEFSPNYKK